MVLQITISSGVEQAMWPVLPSQIAGGPGTSACLRKSTLALEEPKSLLFSLLTSRYSLAGLAFAFIFQPIAGDRTVLWAQSRRFSVCGAGQGQAVSSRMCLPGECWREE